MQHLRQQGYEVRACGILAAFGRDCAGAIMVLPDGDRPGGNDASGYSPMTPADLERVIGALDVIPLAAAPERGFRPSLAGFQRPRTLQATATRRALLLTALGGLLIAGLVTAIPVVGTGSGPLAGYINSDPVPSTGAKSDAAFSRATDGESAVGTLSASTTERGN